jgi:Leucine-rich repeat (LRR) protein
MSKGSMRSLVELDPYNNHLTDASAVAIAECTALPSLEILDISANDLSDEGHLAIVHSTNLPPNITLTR